MGIILNAKTMAIHLEADIAAQAEAIVPFRLLLAILRPYPGLILLVVGFGAVCGYIGHLV